MKEIFLLKLGEIVLKGSNKRQFEARLRANVKRRMRFYGNFDVYIMQSTVYIEPMDELCDVDGAWEACRSIFGVVSLCRCRACEKNLDAIFEAIEEYLGDDLDCAKSFKVESKRYDKSFPLGSIQISQAIGGRLAEAHPTVAVDVHHPDYTVFVEVRDLAAYVHGPAVPGAGGLPTGVGGRAMCLLSGGIDSPVAAYMMAKRGMEVECVHFFSYPYTSQLARDKVMELARHSLRSSTSRAARPMEQPSICAISQISLPSASGILPAVWTTTSRWPSASVLYRFSRCSSSCCRSAPRIRFQAADLPPSSAQLGRITVSPVEEAS
jgi:thiamine biosynthesis protein ThiI